MIEKLSFKQTVWTGVVLAGLCGVAMATAGIYALHVLSSVQDEIISDHAADVTHVAKLGLAIERHFGSEKAYLVTGNEEFLRERDANERELTAQLERMPTYVTSTEGKRLLASVEESARAYRSAMDAAVAKRSSGASPEDVRQHFESEVTVKRRTLDATLVRLEDYKVKRLDSGREIAAEMYEHGQKVLLRAFIFGIFGIVALGTVGARLLLQLDRERASGPKRSAPATAQPSSAG